MKHNFIITNNALEEITIESKLYHTSRGLFLAMLRVCDKHFGEGTWERVPNFSPDLGNALGWYAREKDGDETLEVRFR